MPKEKIKFALRIHPETQELVREMCLRDNCKSQNEFIEKAIHFYAGYVSGREATAYLPEALVSALRSTMELSENRASRLLFKLAVEMALMTRVLAIGLDIDPNDLEKLRGQCVRDVKKSNGAVSFRDAVEGRAGLE